MKANDRARLTTALRTHVAKIAADLRAQMRDTTRAPGAARVAAEQLHKDERVAEDFEVWTDLLSRRAAVLWVLKFVYVRVLEDRGLLAPGRLLDPDLYQVRVALLWSLRRGKLGDDFIVSLETLDDVTFESKGGTPEELFQRSTDRHRVLQMFRLIFEAVEAVAPGLQIILIEYADLNEDWYRDAIVERWRGGKKLVPEDWKREGEGATE
jgi:hypothetical protein